MINRFFMLTDFSMILRVKKAINGLNNTVGEVFLVVPYIVLNCVDGHFNASWLVLFDLSGLMDRNFHLMLLILVVWEAVAVDTTRLFWVLRVRHFWTIYKVSNLLIFPEGVRQRRLFDNRSHTPH